MKVGKLHSENLVLGGLNYNNSAPRNQQIKDIQSESKRGREEDSFANPQKTKI